MKKFSLSLFALALVSIIPAPASAETVYEWNTLTGETTEQWMDRMYDQAVRIQDDFKASGLDGTVVTGATNGVGIGNYITPDGTRYDSVASYLNGDSPITQPSVRSRTDSGGPQTNNKVVNVDNDTINGYQTAQNGGQNHSSNKTGGSGSNNGWQILGY